MKKAVIVQLASQYIHSSLGGWAAAQEAINQGIPVNVLDFHINQPISQLVEKIVETKPDWLAFSCYIWNIEISLKLATSIKALFPKCIIVFGGPEMQKRERYLMENYPIIDVIVTGPGEIIVAQLLKETPYEQINGIHFRKNGEICANPPKLTKGSFPSPYSDEYFKALNGRISYIETTRGCPFSCAFCMSGARERMNILSIEESIERIEILSKSESRTIKFVDRTFNAPKSHSRAIWKYLIDQYSRFSDKRFHFEIGADLLDDEDFSILKKAPKNYFQVEAGIQSFHEETLEACNRKTDMTILTKNLKRLIALDNIPVHIDLIAGLPYEDFNTFLDSFDKAFELNSDMLQLGFLKLLHGCQLATQKERYGYVETTYPPYEVMENKFITFDELKILKGIEAIHETLCTHGRYKNALEYLLNTTKLPASQLFLAIEKSCREIFMARISHSDFIERIINEFPIRLNVPKMGLRDNLLLDELLHTSQGALPKALHVNDDRLQQFKRVAEEKYPKQKLRVGILYEKSCYVTVRYVENKTVETEYTSL